MTFTEFFTVLARDGRAPRDSWPADQRLEDFGLLEQGAWVIPAAPFDPLSAEEIRRGLSRRARNWLVSLEVLPVVGSTNAELMERARHAPVNGSLYTAELQLSGRGRRGRRWMSPFGANLAISMGIAVDRPAADLGGASLVVGLAALDALEQFGIDGLALKWPNDLLLNEAKLGGILIELAQAQGTELVVGLGLNVSLPDSARRGLPDAVADLASVAAAPERSRLVAAITSSVVEFLDEFARVGFVPFIPAFNQRHCYQGRECQVLAGDGAQFGVVSGVAQGGELILDTPEGPKNFHGGEVSLRRT
ncbi:MAG: biotin--[acetyl-CoA-carboxylase] ligase [Gammaproteobacteria bacterium]|nr:biotin--[acetyl-CoA-carboxylase] ligase [Gammaproteobacteria bacterium]